MYSLYYVYCTHTYAAAAYVIITWLKRMCDNHTVVVLEIPDTALNILKHFE